MKIQKISYACCPKPKQNATFKSAYMTPDAIKVLTGYVAKNIDAMDDFKAIGKMDICIDVDKFSRNSIKHLVITQQNGDKNYRLIAPILNMKDLRTIIEEFYKN